MKTRLLPTFAAAASLALLTSLALALLAAPPFATRAHGDTLWDQPVTDPWAAGYFNSLSGSLPFGMTIYTLCDVTVGPGGWSVESISQTYSGLDAMWGLAIEQGRLVVMPKTGAQPGPADDPTTGTTVPMTGVQAMIGEGTVWVVTASGLHLDLSPGDYWIGITPVAPSGFFGPETQISTGLHVGADSPSFDGEGAFGPAGWMVFQPGMDANITITGVVQDPTPASTVTWGRIKTLSR